MNSFSYLGPVYCSKSSSNCCFLTWVQVSQEAGQVVWYSHLLKNFPQFFVTHTVKGFGIVNKAGLNIWMFSVHVLLEPGLENFEHYFANVWNKHNCVVVWTFFGIGFLWDWNENTFSSPVATAEFSKFAGILSAALSQHHLLGFEIAQLEFQHLH